ncbi:MAG: VOC family protein [Candidatus Hodarchaeales archaeon]|jgi:PhnB protein
MKHPNPFLIFNGNCKEARIFYRECLEGEIKSMQTFGDSPVEFPEDCRHLIFDSELKAEKIIIKASDSLPDNPMVIGRNISLFIVFSDKKESENVYRKLLEGGKTIMSLADSHSDGKFGMITGKYQIQ